jgi:predicted XRE-type DNA-binding protein
VTTSDGTVHADVWEPEPDKDGLKRDMAGVIAKSIKRLSLTQDAAAERIGISTKDLTDILSGEFSGYSLPRLIEMGSKLTGIRSQEWSG